MLHPGIDGPRYVHHARFTAPPEFERRVQRALPPGGPAARVTFGTLELDFLRATWGHASARSRPHDPRRRQLRLEVIDAKCSPEATGGHRMQVGYYVLCLQVRVVCVCI